MENKIKLLVISFYFPPCPMVASRRWAKHLKYLNKTDVDFIVLTNNFDHESSSWEKDILQFKDKIVRVPFKIKHPFFKTKLPKSFTEKIIWKLSYWNWKFICKRKNTLLGDDSIGAESAYLEKAIELIKKESITHVILTVGPFSISKIIPELKIKFPHLKINIDYRDYWNSNTKNISNNLFKKEMKLQDLVLSNVDSITVVDQEMKDYFSKLTNNKKNLLVLPHCFDIEDLIIKDDDVHEIKDFNKTLSFTYGGALYSEMENHINAFVNFINSISNEIQNVTINFYVPYNNYESEFSFAKEKVYLNEFLSTNDYFKILNQTDFLIYFRPDWSPNAFSSKFYEMVVMRKPILYFGPKGHVSEFLIKENLGIHFSPNNFDESLERYLNLINKTQAINTNYNMQEHTFEYQNTVLINFLNN